MSPGEAAYTKWAQYVFTDSGRGGFGWNEITEDSRNAWEVIAGSAIDVHIAACIVRDMTDDEILDMTDDAHISNMTDDEILTYKQQLVELERRTHALKNPPSATRNYDKGFPSAY